MSRTNAKKEFLDHVASTGKQVKCASIQYCCDWYSLKINHNALDAELFLYSLDFCYDSGFGGGQELYGTIWYTDGTWSERGEYDGSEWWNYCEVPEIPDELK